MTGTFTFIIEGDPTDTNTSNVSKTVVITLNNGTYQDESGQLTEENGYFVVPDLPLGNYTITESEANIAGYTLSTTFSVNGTTVTGNSATVTLSGNPLTATVEATNAYNAGVELPSTGGPGTVVYTAAGLSLMSIALWMLLRRRKEQQN